MGEPFRGIFPVLQTVVRPDGTVDPDGLRSEVQFCQRAGVHGMVFPVLGSEFQYLTETERIELIRVVVEAAGGRTPVVAGVAGPSAPIAEEMARKARDCGADAVIALPPYLAGANRDEIREYYRRVAAAAQLPVFIQHSQGGMDAALLAELLRDIDHVQYLKEEMPPSAHQISAVLGRVGPECLGVFAGGHNRWMMSELDRGASGFMPATEAADVHVRIWERYQAGDHRGARQLFNQLLPLINQILLLGLPVCKEVLVRRGVIAHANMRTPGSGQLDAGDRAELDRVLEDLQALMRA